MIWGKFVHNSVKHRFIYVQQEFDRTVMEPDKTEDITS